MRASLLVSALGKGRVPGVSIAVAVVCLRTVPALHCGAGDDRQAIFQQNDLCQTVEQLQLRWKPPKIHVMVHGWLPVEIDTWTEIVP